MAGGRNQVLNKAQDGGASDVEDEEERPGRRRTRTTRLSLQTRDVAGE